MAKQDNQKLFGKCQKVFWQQTDSNFSDHCNSINTYLLRSWARHCAKYITYNISLNFYKFPQ